MTSSPHIFHIPVMGTGHSVDSPIRVAHLGISSVISIVDDLLLERIRKHYSKEYDLPFQSIARNAQDGRAARITAYLDMVHEIVSKNFVQVKQSTFHTNSDKDRYFGMLASDNPLRILWSNLPNYLNSHDLNAAKDVLNNALTS